MKSGGFLKKPPLFAAFSGKRIEQRGIGYATDIMYRNYNIILKIILSFDVDNITE